MTSELVNDDLKRGKMNAKEMKKINSKSQTLVLINVRFKQMQLCFVLFHFICFLNEQKKTIH